MMYCLSAYIMPAIKLKTLEQGYKTAFKGYKEDEEMMY